jgi:hypothetical protein
MLALIIVVFIAGVGAAVGVLRWPAVRDAERQQPASRADGLSAAPSKPEPPSHIDPATIPPDAPLPPTKPAQKAAEPPELESLRMLQSIEATNRRVDAALERYDWKGAEEYLHQQIDQLELFQARYRGSQIAGKAGEMVEALKEQLANIEKKEAELDAKAAALVAKAHETLERAANEDKSGLWINAKESLQEAKRYLRDAIEAGPGTRSARQARDALLKLP